MNYVFSVITQLMQTNALQCLFAQNKVKVYNCYSACNMPWHTFRDKKSSSSSDIIHARQQSVQSTTVSHTHG